MKDLLKKLFSRQVIIILLVALLVLTSLNTYMILGNRAINGNVVNYDFVLSRDGGNYKLTYMLTGFSTVEPTSWQISVSQRRQLHSN